jgi:hypothetical protein
LEKKFRPETQIKLNRFKPRPYQLPIIDAIENKHYKRVVAILPRRCLSGETHILLSNGSWKFLRDIKVGDEILSWNGASFEKDIVKNVWKTGVKDTLIVNSPRHLPVVVSEDHKFASLEQGRDSLIWKTVGKIKKQQVLNYAGIWFGALHNPDLAEFIGYMTCDGYCVGYQQPKFTNTNNEILRRVEYLTKKIFYYRVVWRKKGNGYDLGMTNGSRGGGYIKNKVKELFREHGQDIPKSKMRLLPMVWDFDKESLLRFFAAVISSDGSLYCHKTGFSTNGRAVPPGNEITISCGQSYDLCWDMYWLLRKIGIFPQVPKKERDQNWKVRITKGCDAKVLLSGGPIYGKESKQKEMLSRIPDSPRKQPSWNGCVRSSLKKTTGDREELYDIETDKNHNFVANGYVVHNSGKDITAWNIIIRAALRKIGVYYYIFPTYAQAKKVIWDSITNTGDKILDYIPEELVLSKNSQEMKIVLCNDSIIQLVGSTDYDRLMGTNPQGCVFSEYALQDPRCYQYIRPILTANDGWALFISTPRGKNSLFELYQIAQHSNEWFAYKLTVADTGHISMSAIQKEKEDGVMSEDLIQQEYFCSFNLGVEGAYYSRILDKLRVKGQIGVVPVEPGFKVHTAWDLGVRDSTAIIFFQVTGQIIRIVDCYENTKVGLDHYAKILAQKDYLYGKHIAPHDIAVRELGSGITRIEKARSLGIKFIVADKISIEDGIEAVRSALPRMWFDKENCSDLLKALENYRQEWDIKKKVYKGRPLHNWASNFCDSLRYLCVSLPKTRDGLTPEELDKRYNEAMYGDQGRLPAPFRDDYRGY